MDHVLKVSGKRGPEKVQNETACLLLLERYCPAVPTPRVIAYSDDSQVIRIVKRCQSDGLPEAVQHHAHPAILGSQSRPWILLTRCPGEQLEAANLHGDRGEYFLKQLAEFIAQWRHQIPKAQRIGNVQILDSATIQDENDLDTFPGIPPLRICGLLQCDRNSSDGILTALQYYDVQLRDQLAKLETNENFATIRDELIPIVRDFIDHTLPKLYLFRGMPQRATFTHNDLSPRNILVSETGIVTGVLDFEFAGFFPAEEDFTNNEVHNREDWPESTDAVLFEELERLGVETPLTGFDKRAWQEARVLVRVIANIAPWYVAGGGMQRDELVIALSEAVTEVRNGSKELELGPNVIRTAPS